MIHKKFMCSICKKKFSTPIATAQHQRDYHGRSALIEVEPPRKRREGDDEPSYADLTIAAEQNKAAGLSYETLLLGEST